mgnify:CR=1 FL=1
MTLTDLLKERASKQHTKVLVRDSAIELTYLQAAGAVSLLGSHLARSDDRPNVGLMLPTSAGFMVAFYGILSAGKTAVPLNFLLAGPEIEYMIRDAELATLIATEHFREKVEGLPLNVVYIEELFRSNPEAVPPPVEANIDDESTAVILYTSGTTAKPKGVRLSHAGLLANAEGGAEMASVNEGAPILSVLPNFHAFALTTTVVLPVALGATVTCLERFTPQAFANLVGEHKIEFVPGVSSMFRALLMLKRHPEAAGALKSLKVCVSGGEPLMASTAKAFEAFVGVPLLEGYGLTEAGPVVSVNPPGANRPSTAGKPLNNLRVRIVDENDRPAPAGAEGEIQVAGPSVMQGYHNDPQATAAAITEDGYLRTGDLGILDEDGYLSISGRLSELIISHGENIHPPHVEEAILEVPGVYQAAVVGLPDETRGEIVKAFVVLEEDCAITAEEIKAALRDKLAPYKIPRQIEFRDELPVGPTGKVLKKKLKGGMG